MIESSLQTIPLERMAVADVLGCVEPFCGIGRSDLESLASNATRIRKAPGVALFEDGAVWDACYVVLRGRVNLVRRGEAQRDLILLTLGAGDVLGEACAFDRTRAATAAVAATSMEALRIPADVLGQHLRGNADTMMRLMQLVTRKLHDIESVASSLALHDVEERLRRTLVRLAQRQGRRAPDQSSWVIAPVPTQSELARMVGSCRETVSRTLSAMAREGLLHASGRRMVLDPRLLCSAAA